MSNPARNLRKLHMVPALFAPWASRLIEERQAESQVSASST